MKSTHHYNLENNLFQVKKENQETRSQSFTSSCVRCAVAFVCSALEFCLQCAGVLFAVYNSFVCSALEFCLQCAGVLLRGKIYNFLSKFTI